MRLLEWTAVQLRTEAFAPLMLRKSRAVKALHFPDRLDVAQRFVGVKTLQLAKCATRAEENAWARAQDGAR
jgi:hypothetical protein